MKPEDITCTLCQAKTIRVLLDFDDNPVLECRNCGMVFRRAVVDLTERELFDLANTVGEESESPTARYDASYHDDDPRVRLWRDFLGELDRLKQSTGKRLLDVGSAKGAFLDVAAREGWEPEGIEPSETDSDYSRGVFNLPVFTGTLKEAKLPSEQYDAVTMLDVIEHLWRPSETISETFRVLKPGGALIVFTPNHDSLIFLLARWLRRIGFRGSPLELLYPVVHVHYFTPRSLSRLLRQAGFAVARLGSGPLHPEKCLASTRTMRFGASLVELASRMLNRRYRVSAIGVKPL